ELPNGNTRLESLMAPPYYYRPVISELLLSCLAPLTPKLTCLSPPSRSAPLWTSAGRWGHFASSKTSTTSIWLELPILVIASSSSSSKASRPCNCARCSRYSIFSASRWSCANEEPSMPAESGQLDVYQDDLLLGSLFDTEPLSFEYSAQWLGQRGAPLPGIPL